MFLLELTGYDCLGSVRGLQHAVERESADSSPHEGLSALADRKVEMIQTASPRAMRTSRSGRATRDTTLDTGIEDPAGGHR